MKQAGVYVNDIFCGILTEDEEGFHFAYDEIFLASQNAIALSPTMPLTIRQYDKEVMFPVWKRLIGQSFLPEKMKDDYIQLLTDRTALL